MPRLLHSSDRQTNLDAVATLEGMDQHRIIVTTLIASGGIAAAGTLLVVSGDDVMEVDFMPGIALSNPGGIFMGGAGEDVVATVAALGSDIDGAVFIAGYLE